MEWISVKDRLPENNEYVLAWDSNDIFILKFEIEQDKRKKQINRIFNFSSSSGEEYFDAVTHWMPLPEKPGD